MPGPEFQERSFDCVPRPPNCGGKENARDFAQDDGQMIWTLQMQQQGSRRDALRTRSGQASATKGEFGPILLVGIAPQMLVGAQPGLAVPHSAGLDVPSTCTSRCRAGLLGCVERGSNMFAGVG